MGADYADDLALLLNTHTHTVESLLHSLEQAARSSGLYVNLYKAEFILFLNKMEPSPH